MTYSVLFDDGGDAVVEFDVAVHDLGLTLFLCQVVIKLKLYFLLLPIIVPLCGH